MTNFESFSGHMSDRWCEMLTAADKARRPYLEVAHMCYAFYSGDHRFMYEEPMRSRLLGSVPPPKTPVTINKAYEFVQVMGPYLFWERAGRTVKPRDSFQIDPNALGDANNPAFIQWFQQNMMQQGLVDAQARLAAEMMEKYLNYSSDEQPHTQAYHIGLALIDGLVKGRGVLWPEVYSFPMSRRKLTGLFWDSSDRLLVDPDCYDPQFETAEFVCRVHHDPLRRVEKLFGYEHGALKGAGNLTNAKNVILANEDPISRFEKRQGKTHDIMTWYEIFSRTGIGTNLKHEYGGPHRVFQDRFDEVVGDFVRVCVSPGVPWFLNAPPSFLESANVQEVREAFAWPAKTFHEGQFPMAKLDFNPNTESAYPIPPLGPALGELIAMNMLTSALVERGYESRKVIIGCLGAVQKEWEQQLATDANPAILGLREGVTNSIKEALQIIQYPGLNGDLEKALEMLNFRFEERTGLNATMYGSSTKIERTASGARSKEERAQGRVDRMALDVTAFVTDASNKERLLAADVIVPERDIPELLSPMGVFAWRQLITDQPLEVIARSMKAVVGATETRKPNRERDTANFHQVIGFMLPLLQQYAMSTGNTDPLNQFLGQYAKAIEADPQLWQLGPWLPPPPSPEQLQMQQMAAQADIQETQASAEHKIAQAVKALADARAAGFEQQSNDMAKQRLSLLFDAAKHTQQLQQSSDKHVQELTQNQLKFMQELKQAGVRHGFKSSQFDQQRALRKVS